MSQSAALRHQNQSLFGHSSSYSRTLICRDRIPSPPREDPQDTPLEDLTTGLMDITRVTPLPFLTIVGTTKKLALALVNTLTARTQREHGLVLINGWIST